MHVINSSENRKPSPRFPILDHTIELPVILFKKHKLIALVGVLQSPLVSQLLWSNDDDYYTDKHIYCFLWYHSHAAKCWSSNHTVRVMMPLFQDAIKISFWYYHTSADFQQTGLVSHKLEKFFNSVCLRPPSYSGLTTPFIKKRTSTCTASRGNVEWKMSREFNINRTEYRAATTFVSTDK